MGSVSAPLDISSDPIEDRMLQLQDAISRYRNSKSSGKESIDPTAYDHAMQAIRSLQLEVERPEEFVVRVRYQGHQVTAINILIDMGVFDALVSRNGAKTTSRQLAHETGCDELLIVRLLRLMTAVGCVDEVGHQTYRSNARTAELSKPGQVATFRYMASMEWPCSINIRDYLEDSNFHRDCNKVKKSAFEYAFGSTFWDYLSQPDNDEKKRNFDTQMQSGRRAASQQLWFQRYPPVKELSIESLRSDADAVLMVDVGGGRGRQVKEFRQAYPDLCGRCICQDTPETIATIEDEVEGVEMMEYDFFTPQPVKGARFYLFRSICHDWTTAKCRQILTNTVEAMDPEYSSLLIDEWVLPAMNASEKAVCLDISMMLNFNAMERTQRQWTALLEDVGLEVIGVYRDGEGRGSESIIEAKVRRSA